MSTAVANPGFTTEKRNDILKKARLEDGFYNIIDGERVTSEKKLSVIEPATGQELATAPDLDQAGLDRAIQAARRAFPAWAKLPIEERRAILNKALDTLEQHYEEISILVTRETGRTLMTVDWELKLIPVGYRHLIKNIELPREEFDLPEMGHVVKDYVPLGVVCAISPWNFPVFLSFSKIIPALLTGNTMVLKPSPFTPLSVLRIADYLRPILPPGVLNVITGGDEMGPWMTSHPGFDKIAFTGSTQTGKRVFASAASELKHMTLELGGNDPGIVLPDADPEAIAESLFWAMFLGNGQICMGLKRLFVHEDLYPRLTKALVRVAEKIKVGDGLDPEVGVGASQNRPQFERLQATWKEIEESGAKVLFRGQIPQGTQGYFFPVTILDNPPADASFVTHENFGPLRSVLKYKTIEEAISKANNTEYGLGASVWGKDENQLEAVARQIDSGLVWINQHTVMHPSVPFTGHKHSGFGTEFGREGLEHFSTIQLIARR